MNLSKFLYTKGIQFTKAFYYGEDIRKVKKDID